MNEKDEKKKKMRNYTERLEFLKIKCQTKTKQFLIEKMNANNNKKGVFLFKFVIECIFSSSTEYTINILFPVIYIL